jgi:hypothetical protein
LPMLVMELPEDLQQEEQQQQDAESEEIVSQSCRQCWSLNQFEHSGTSNNCLSNSSSCS